MTPEQEALVEHHMPIAQRLAARFAAWMDDADQIALLALVLSASRYDPARGPFLPFAIPTIRGELKRAARDHSRSVRLPRAVHDALMEIKPVVAELQQRLGREPTIGELTKATALDEEIVVEALAAWARPEPESEAEGMAAHGDMAERVSTEVTLHDAIERLRPEDREAVMAYYYGNQTQQEIADGSGVSQMQIHRRLKRALAELSAAVDASRS